MTPEERAAMMAVKAEADHLTMASEQLEDEQMELIWNAAKEWAQSNWRKIADGNLPAEGTSVLIAGREFTVGVGDAAPVANGDWRMAVGLIDSPAGRAKLRVVAATADSRKRAHARKK